MSCYEWEGGTIKLSSKAFPVVLKAVQLAHNAHYTKEFERAMQLYTFAKKGLPHIDPIIDTIGGRYEAMIRHGNYDEGAQDILYRMFHGKDRKVRATPLQPLKKDYAPANGATLQFHVGECSATFNRKERTVRWHVSENNNACEHAQATWLAAALFGALNRVEWTRGTGGQIIGNDEYNRDSSAAGGGGNYVKMEFSPSSKGKRKYDRQYYHRY